MLKLSSKNKHVNKQIKCSSCGELKDKKNIKYCSTLNCKEPYCLFCLKTNKVYFYFYN